MKNYRIFTAIIILIITVGLLSGCGPKAAKRQLDGGSAVSGIVGNGAQLDGDIVSDKNIMTEPPILSAYIDGKTDTDYQLTLGGYHWAYKAENGAMMGTVADVPHPLQMSDTTEITVGENNAVLVLNIDCESVSVSYWPADAEVEEPSEAVELSGLSFDISKGRVYSVVLSFSEEQYAEYIFKTI